ncbi:hypothetical protein EV401DRAFT_77794 [Pisolithus croceorrhizus]|nr:hypothetical protein EV401DRAFT_77794 [Pisolithus croceorrhizus]
MEDEEGFVVISHNALTPQTETLSIIGPLMDHNTALCRELAATRNTFQETIQKVMVVFHRSSTGHLMDHSKVFAIAECDLSCAICLGVLSRPLMLPDCGHTYCGSCLESFFSKQMERRPSSQRTCPTCRNYATSTPVPVFILHGLLDGMSAVAREMREVLSATQVHLAPALDSFISDI